jgi:hypothetical protein
MRHLKLTGMKGQKVRITTYCFCFLASCAIVDIAYKDGSDMFDMT